MIILTEHLGICSVLPHFCKGAKMIHIAQLCVSIHARACDWLAIVSPKPNTGLSRRRKPLALDSLVDTVAIHSHHPTHVTSWFTNL